MNLYSDEFNAMEREELRREDRARRNYLRQLGAHPHPNDPDHPDCPEEEEEE